MKNYFSKGLILSFVSILFTSSLFAQIRWGVNVGYNFNDNIASFRPLTQPTNGFHLGPQLSYHWEKAEYVEQKQQDYPLGPATQAGGYYTPTDYLPIDITIGAGLGCQYQHFFAHLTYDQGVLNRLQEAYALGKNNTNQLFSRSLSLTLGYNF